MAAPRDFHGRGKKKKERFMAFFTTRSVPLEGGGGGERGKEGRKEGKWETHSRTSYWPPAGRGEDSPLRQRQEWPPINIPEIMRSGRGRRTDLTLSYVWQRRRRPRVTV